MATRNLTRKFLDLRTSFNLNSKTSSGRQRNGSNAELLKTVDIESSSNWKPNKEAMPPIWVDNMDRIEQDIAKIQSKMMDLKGLHTKRLMVNFESDEKEQERDIDRTTQEITEIFRNAEGLLKKIGDHIPGSSDAELVIRKNMQRSMAKKLQGLSMSFRSTQKEYLMRLQAQKSGSGAQAFEFLESKSKKVNSVDPGFSDAQMMIVDDLTSIVDQRDEEITRIAKSIEELAQIFKELAVLVIDQGTILDRIDYNMEHAVENAEEGVKQLVKAEEHQKSALSIRCIILLIVLIAVMLIILILKHTTIKT